MSDQFHAPAALAPQKESPEKRKRREYIFKDPVANIIKVKGKVVPVLN
jgi:hypothetical protein